MANQVLDDRSPSGRIEDALDYVRFGEIARLAELASSYWRSVMLAADRGDTLTVATHCQQVAAISREAFALVGALGSSADAPP
jgi:hypothetical protein